MSSVIEELLWTEKYRPRSLKDIVNQKDIVERLQKFVAEKNMPHLLFAGPPGTGKTTAAHALAHDLYGEGYTQFMLELNASDERGIDTIREKVKEFARRAALFSGSLPLSQASIHVRNWLLASSWSTTSSTLFGLYFMIQGVRWRLKPWTPPGACSSSPATPGRR